MLGGHNIRGSNGERIQAFKDTASSPANMCASRVALAHTMLTPGGVCKQSDGQRAYTQSRYEGPPLWVRLPKKWWPQTWKDRGFHDPVVPLVFNLYGHPTAGHGWEKHFEAKLALCGFKGIEGWSSVFFNSSRNVLAVVYVDDLVLSGPADKHEAIWARLSKHIGIEDPEPLDRFLGRSHEPVP